MSLFKNLDQKNTFKLLIKLCLTEKYSSVVFLIPTTAESEESQTVSCQTNAYKIQLDQKPFQGSRPVKVLT